MSFWWIVGIVLLAVIVLSFIFAFFHLLFLLLPAILVIAGILWLINHFTKNDNQHESNDNRWNQWTTDRFSQKPKRKKARDAHAKDVDK